ncbi:Uncharacterised protein [Klebsiella pneumoniae]|uniref:Uncharacterized protein n=1 Tax=Klebsiella pneumoniae TaxID=573 RepID=A0A377VZQ6_KLEPN|nr:Uncharacterised protein [Klebsiella pneumoniae]
MCISKPKVSSPQVQAAPQVSDSAVQNAADSDRRRRRAAAGGQKSTILTSSQGVTQPSGGTQGKTLLGA